MNIKKAFVLTCILILVCLPTASVFAVEDKEVEQIRSEIQKKIKEKLNNITEKQKKRGWIGTVQNKTQISFELKNSEQVRTISLNEELKIVDSERTEVDYKNLEEGSRIIAMGYLQVDGNLDTKRIVVLKASEPRKTISIWAKINDKSSEIDTLLVTNSQTEEEYELIVNSKSVLEKRGEKGLETINYDELTVDQKIIAILSPVKSNGNSYYIKKLLIL